MGMSPKDKGSKKKMANDAKARVHISSKQAKKLRKAKKAAKAARK